MTAAKAAKTQWGEIHNASRKICISASPEIASSFLSRGKGLMLRSAFPEGSAMVIDPCTSIHMFFMRIPLDVLYLNRDDVVVRVQEGIKPWRVGPLRTKGAAYVIELPAGTVARTNTQVGDRIVFTGEPG
jgi:uncharacterized protein